MARVEELYDQDFVAWTQDQAEALKDLARARWNGPLDLTHLAEEVEDLGTERRDAVRSQLRRILEHCLKLEWSTATEPRAGWKESIVDARALIEDKLTATLSRDLEERLPRLYDRAVEKAALGLGRYGEQAAARQLPPDCPYTLAHLLQHGWYPPNRHGIVDEL